MSIEALNDAQRIRAKAISNINNRQGLHLVNTKAPRNEHEAAVNVKTWPTDRDLAMLASSGSIEGKSRKPRKRPGLGLLLILSPWALGALFALGYYSDEIVAFALRFL